MGESKSEFALIAPLSYLFYIEIQSVHTNMHAWHTLEDTSITLTRMQHTEDRYRAHRANVLATYPSMSQYIREKVMDNTTGLYFTDNKFPYHLESGVSHFILWNPRNTALPACQRHVHYHFSPTLFDVCLRQNLPHQRSVPDIPHYHVFIRVRHRQAPPPTQA